VRLSPLGTSATVGLLYQTWMIDGDDYGPVGGMRIGRGNRSTRRKSAPAPLYPPQILHDLTWDRTRAVAVGSQRLIPWAMARPVTSLSKLLKAVSKTRLYWIHKNSCFGDKERASAFWCDILEGNLLGEHPTRGHFEISPSYLRVKIKLLGFEVLTEVVVKPSVSWDVTPCSSLNVNGRFGGTYCLHLLATCFMLGLFFDPEYGGDMFLRNVGWLSTGYTLLYLRKYNCTKSTCNFVSWIDPSHSFSSPYASPPSIPAVLLIRMLVMITTW
jgi:hypothetical protein